MLGRYATDENDRFRTFVREFMRLKVSVCNTPFELDIKNCDWRNGLAFVPPHRVLLCCFAGKASMSSTYEERRAMIHVVHLVILWAKALEYSHERLSKRII